jgi:hypothetical protein
MSALGATTPEERLKAIGAGPRRVVVSTATGRLTARYDGGLLTPLTRRGIFSVHRHGQTRMAGILLLSTVLTEFRGAGPGGTVWEKAAAARGRRPRRAPSRDRRRPAQGAQAPARRRARAPRARDRHRPRGLVAAYIRRTSERFYAARRGTRIGSNPRNHAPLVDPRAAPYHPRICFGSRGGRQFESDRPD